MILSDKDIKSLGDRVIMPFSKKYVQPSSYDMHIADEIIQENELKRVEEIKIRPLEFILGTTLEKVRIPENMCGIINGKSTLGRNGLAVHITAGFIDPGFTGNITLELFNHSNRTIELKPTDSVCQLILIELTGDCEKPYGEHDNHYQWQDGVKEPWRDLHE